MTRHEELQATVRHYREQFFEYDALPSVSNIVKRELRNNWVMARRNLEFFEMQQKPESIIYTAQGNRAPRTQQK